MDQASIFLVLLLSAFSPVMETKMIMGECSCAVFPVEESNPIIEHALQFNVTCDQEGAEKCQQLCIALAQGAKEKAPALICEKLNKHVENLKVAVHTKSCNESWNFTGLENPEPICCHDGNEFTCNSTIQLIVGE